MSVGPGDERRSGSFMAGPPLLSLDDALAQAGAFADERASEVLAGADDLLRCRGASDEELAIELSRLRAELAAYRRAVLAMTRSVWETVP